MTSRRRTSSLTEVGELIGNFPKGGSLDAGKTGKQPVRLVEEMCPKLKKRIRT